MKIYKTGDLIPKAGIVREIETGVLLKLNDVMEGDRFGPLTISAYGRGHYVYVEEY